MNLALSMTAQVLITQLENAGGVDAAPADEYPNFEIIEVLDEDSCDLCREMDGMIISRDDPDFELVKDPAHINCRRSLAAVSKDEIGPDGNPLEPDYERPSQEMIDEFGHFMRVPGKYAPLRVPAQPEGRDFVARPYVDKYGKRRVRIDWRVPDYELAAA